MSVTDDNESNGTVDNSEDDSLDESLDELEDEPFRLYSTSHNELAFSSTSMECTAFSDGYNPYCSLCAANDCNHANHEHYNKSGQVFMISLINCLS